MCAAERIEDQARFPYLSPIQAYSLPEAVGCEWGCKCASHVCDLPSSRQHYVDIGGVEYVSLSGLDEYGAGAKLALYDNSA